MKLVLRQLIPILLLFLQGCTTTLTSTSTTKIPPAENNIAAALLEHHQEWRGTPYQLGGNSKQGIDCSAFSQNTYKNIFSMTLPRTTATQVNTGKKISTQELRSGDLVFFKTGSQKQRHVGIYVQEGLFLHASTSKGVMLSKLNNPYWKKHYWIAVRPEGLARLQISNQ